LTQVEHEQYERQAFEQTQIDRLRNLLSSADKTELDDLINDTIVKMTYLIDENKIEKETNKQLDEQFKCLQNRYDELKEKTSIDYENSRTNGRTLNQ
jgi:hypothetical protein